VSLELVHDPLHALVGETCFLRDVPWRKRTPEPGNLRHGEVPNAVVLFGHEREPRGARVLGVLEMAPEDVEGVREDPVAPAHENFIDHMYQCTTITCGKGGFFEGSRRNREVVMDGAIRDLVAVLVRAHAGELAAALAYQGHARSLAEATEAAEVLAIAGEEMEHRESIRRMLDDLQGLAGPDARPRRSREVLFGVLGTVLGRLCRVSGWLAPMYGAGWLESGNIREYEEAAGLAIIAGRPDLAPELLRMAEVEWEHEQYFRAKVLSRRSSFWLAGLLPLWPAPPPRESIGPRFGFLDRGFRNRARSRGSRFPEADPRGPLRPASGRATAR